jgi:hypothetical protein
MAGTLVITTLSDGTNSTSATNPILGSAKAWVNFDGTVATPSTIRSSYNVSSITRTGTGTYTVNFTNAFANANYATMATAGTPGTRANLASIFSGTPTTTATFIATFDTVGGAQNPSYVSVAIFA